MMTILKTAQLGTDGVLAKIKSRGGAAQSDIDARVSEMLTDIQRRGFEAVEEYSIKLDGKGVSEIPRSEWLAAKARCPEKLIRALERAARNIREYQEKLLCESCEWQSSEGGKVGYIVRPIECAGIYVPGGTAAYPSSVLMCAVPAKTAGADKVVMVTPPTGNLSDEVLAAAEIAGVDRVFAVGGVQAVASLAYGLGPIPKADKIVGPGNAYVAAAKKLLFGTIGIDMVAGPSEVLIIADDSANPAFVAADLLSQAEHDRMSSSVLITPSERMLKQVETELEAQLSRLARREIAESALSAYGYLILTENLEECAEISNRLAPEHLELAVENPRSLLPRIRNAGAVFLGHYTPEPLGDYLAGPSHVLPTNGTARFFPPLSAESFLKKISLLEFDRETLAKMSEDTAALARAEGLDAHANSVLIRQGGTL